MKTSTRLILMLTVTVSALMLLASFLLSREREALLNRSAREEVKAHALTLQSALEEDFRTCRTFDLQQLINRLSQNRGIYGVLLFDATGQAVLVSDALKTKDISYVEEARKVIASNQETDVERRIKDEDVISVILPLQGDSRYRAVEIAQSISYVNEDLRRAQRDIILTTFFVCIAIFLVVTFVTHFNLTLPIRELLGGAQAVGRGDLNYRVIVPRSGGEIRQLAREFNRMADHLATQRAAATREAEERLELERKLRHSERLALAGKMAAGIAHEMGAPLQVIDGRAKQILNQTEASIEMRQRNLTIIRSQAERIARIVRQLLNLARPYTLQLSDIDLRQLLAETLELLETNAAQAGIQLRRETGPAVRVNADPHLLNQVFMNICLNAVQTLTLRRKSDGYVRTEFISDWEDKQGRRFSAVKVIDNGGGIAEEHFPPLFDPFFTTREIGQGTGLGLPVSRRIVEEHGGWIEAANNDEGGATFTVYLPQNAADFTELPPRHPESAAETKAQDDAVSQQT